MLNESILTCAMHVFTRAYCSVHCTNVCTFSWPFHSQKFGLAFKNVNREAKKKKKKNERVYVQVKEIIAHSSCSKIEERNLKCKNIFFSWLSLS